jgi:hypothetical protein
VRASSHVTLPAPVQARLERAKDRPGWFIAPETYALDLATEGRDVLARAWHSARDELTGLADTSELEVVDDIVAHRRPIPREQVCGPDLRDAARHSVFGQLHTRERGDARVRVAAMSWAAVAFNVRSAADEFHVVVPRRWLRSFLERLDDGTIDDALAHPVPTSTDTEPRVVVGPFDPRMVVPPEPDLPRSWLHRRRPELVAAITAGAVVVAALHLWPW